MSTNFSLLMIVAFIVMSSLSPVHSQSLDPESDLFIGLDNGQFTYSIKPPSYNNRGVPGRRVGGGSR